MKLCTECRYFTRGPGYNCQHPMTIKGFSPVNGEPIYDHSAAIVHLSRDGGLCGEEGRLWELRDPTFRERLWIALKILFDPTD